ncbi:uncharacterized protein IUM83_03313 [Phytophthora cinnamomi]|uniref:uncharacterized protein n=1 Tax=Phytophthora cinnamomi TaxID=4785 RepID=UPI0035597293|nr:hypothetical protein IUM83_03313 [Phytophthora cinnamomi]
MWWGGPTGKAPPTGEVMTFPPVRGLRYLFKKDKAAYLRRIRDATKPFQIDSPRFQSLTEMLVQTGALVPTFKRSHRLNDKALARVVIDITSPTPVPNHWAPSLTEALGPATAVDNSSSKFREDSDEAVAKMVAEAEAKSKAKKADELEYITNGDEEGVSNEEEDGGSNDEDEGSATTTRKRKKMSRTRRRRRPTRAVSWRVRER